REEPMSGEEHHAGDEKEDPGCLPRHRDRLDSPTPNHRLAADIVNSVKLYGDSHSPISERPVRLKNDLTSENIVCVEDRSRTFILRWEMEFGIDPLPPGF